MKSHNPDGAWMVLYATEEEKRSLLVTDLFGKTTKITCRREGVRDVSLNSRQLHEHLSHFYNGMRIIGYNPASEFYTCGENGKCPAVSFFLKVVGIPGIPTPTTFSFYGESTEELEREAHRLAAKIGIPTRLNSMSHMLKVTRETLVLMGILEEAEEEVTAGA